MTPDLADVLAELDPAEMALHDWVVPRLDAAMVDELAAADYGWDVEDHRQAIRDLMSAKRLPDQLPWHPLEVLSLQSWSPLTDPDHDHAAWQRGHLLRIFCCLVLVRTTTQDGDPIDSLAALVESTLSMEPSAVDAARRYLAWCRLQESGNWRNDPESRPFLTFALLLLCAARPLAGHDRVSRELSRTLIEELIAARTDENASWRTHVTPALTGLVRRERRRTWQALTRRWLIEPPTPNPDPDLAGRLALLGQAVCGDTTAKVDDLREVFARDPAP